MHQKKPAKQASFEKKKINVVWCRKVWQQTIRQAFLLVSFRKLCRSYFLNEAGK
jgi:hypothetical protein